MTPRIVPAECSARIENGKLACVCLEGHWEQRADLSVCHPRMLALMAELPAFQAKPKDA
jgi:hypothetical protein